MDTIEKVAALGSAAKFDICTACCGKAHATARSYADEVAYRAIYHARTAGGQTTPLLKVLQTNTCKHNCAYCANRADRDQSRFRFQPQELAKTFMDFRDRGLVTGLFLSSGVDDSPARAMQEMLTTAEILRHRYKFAGYIHLKVLPGAPYDCVERAVELANRVSINMEAPTEGQLTRIAPDKHMFGDVVQRMHWIRKAAGSHEGAMSSGQTTQFIVGAGRETDHELLTAATALYRDVNLRRAYFSGFEPITDTPLESQPAAPPSREHRLYQVDWLLRCYSGAYSLGDIIFGDDANLPLDIDPKLAIAFQQRDYFPIEVNQADHVDLLRVPGIGPRSAQAILKARKVNRFAELVELRRVGVVTRRAAPFILINGQPQGSIEALTHPRTRRQRDDTQLPLPLEA